MAEQTYRDVPIRGARGEIVVDNKSKGIWGSRAVRYRIPTGVNVTPKISEEKVRQLIVGQPTFGSRPGPLTKEEAQKARVRLELLPQGVRPSVGLAKQGTQDFQILSEISMNLGWSVHFSSGSGKSRPQRYASYIVDALTGALTVHKPKGFQ